VNFTEKLNQVFVYVLNMKIRYEEKKLYYNKTTSRGSVVQILHKIKVLSSDTRHECKTGVETVIRHL